MYIKMAGKKNNRVARKPALELWLQRKFRSYGASVTVQSGQHHKIVVVFADWLA